MNSRATKEAVLEKSLRILVQVLVWAGLFTVLYILRSFFLLIFLTFVFAYILANLTNQLQSRINSRSICVVIVFLVFLALLVGLGAFLIPNLKAQGDLFASQFGVYMQRLDEQLHKLVVNYPEIGKLLPSLPTEEHAGHWSIANSSSAKVLQSVFGSDSHAQDAESVKDLVKAATQIGGGLMGVVSAFFLSLLFSFLIVLDLPKLTKSVQGLADTKIAFIYHQVVPTIASFGRVMGRAMEAQLFIALLNSFLTILGLYVLGLGNNVAFLGVIVFLCSFIPVAGVFISSVPICLMALEAYGVHMMFLAALLITVIHMIEAYILNPKIYGHHLHMNPVLVLIILTVGGKLFGVWGLVLGVPLCTYIFGHAIRDVVVKDNK